MDNCRERNTSGVTRREDIAAHPILATTNLISFRFWINLLKRKWQGKDFTFSNRSTHIFSLWRIVRLIKQEIFVWQRVMIEPQKSSMFWMVKRLHRWRVTKMWCILLHSKSLWQFSRYWKLWPHIKGIWYSNGKEFANPYRSRTRGRMRCIRPWRKECCKWLHGLYCTVLLYGDGQMPPSFLVS